MLAADIDGGDAGGRGRAGHIQVPAQWHSSPQRRIQGDVCPRAGRQLPVAQGRLHWDSHMWRSSIEAAVAAVAVDMAPVMVCGDAGGMGAPGLRIYDMTGQCAPLLVGAEAGDGEVQHPGRSARQSGSQE